MSMEGKLRIVTLNKHKESRIFRAKSVQASNDMWFEILSRLPTKTLVISKCVCKSWRDFASHILVQQRNMPFLSVRGVFFMVCRFASEDEVHNAHIRTKKYDTYLVYLSLTTKEIALRIDSPTRNTVNYGYSEQLLGNLSIDLNPLYGNPSLIAENKMFYTAHKGLILSVLFDGTYQVVNPATNQVLQLPKPRNKRMFLKNGGNWIYNHAIINLSSPLSSTVCSFVVMRFLKPYGFVELYYPKTRKWVRCRFAFEVGILLEGWYLANCVFLRQSRTLVFLTTIGRGVAFQFGSLDHEPKICDACCFCLPKVVCIIDIAFTKLGESQGCLYLSHVDLDKDVGGMWIWKHCGVFSAANPWIPLFEFSSCYDAEVMSLQAGH